MFVLDVSRSMLAADAPPNRLERAKVEISEFMSRIPDSRVGLVVFAGKPLLQVPLTIDYYFFRIILRKTGPDVIGRGGFQDRRRNQASC